MHGAWSQASTAQRRPRAVARAPRRTPAQRRSDYHEGLVESTIAMRRETDTVAACRTLRATRRVAMRPQAPCGRASYAKNASAAPVGFPGWPGREHEAHNAELGRGFAADRSSASCVASITIAMRR